MMHPYFFGYGSLVNRGTHAFPGACTARLRGWRRAWRGTSLRELAFLTAVPDAGAVVEGMIAQVPGDDWAALDQRERAYGRHDVSGGVAHEAGDAHSVQVYAIHADHVSADEAAHPILLSYIDVVAQGFLREYGVAGAVRFFETTDGWARPVLNDRAAPRYPRAQRLDAEERCFVDMQLDRLGVHRS